MENNDISTQMKVETGDAGYVLEDVPHLTDYIPNLPVTSHFLLFFCYICILYFIGFI